MDKETLRKRIRRNRRITLLQNCIKVAVCVGAAVVLVSVGWTIAKPFVRQSEWIPRMPTVLDRPARLPWERT